MKFQYLPLFVLFLVISVATAQTNEGANNLVDDMASANSNLVLEFLESRNPDMLALDVELHFAGNPQPMIGRDLAINFPKNVYVGFGDILGETIDLINVIPLANNTIIVEYIFHGTAFTGDEYMRQNMLAPVELHIPMLSVFKLDKGLITHEYVFETTTSEYRYGY